jgi:CO/xanthine dehydrogenase Mo-binding subunit
VSTLANTANPANPVNPANRANSADAAGAAKPVVGAPLNRVDGRLKVRGAAPYPLDVHVPGMAHAVLVQSRAVSGRIRHIATSAAEQAPGVIAIVTHTNAPKLARAGDTPLGPSPLPALQTDRIDHFGQHIAIVIAETLEQAQEAATLIEVTYDLAAPAAAAGPTAVADGAAASAPAADANAAVAASATVRAATAAGASAAAASEDAGAAARATTVGADAAAAAAGAGAVTILSLDDPRAEQVTHRWTPDHARGDFDAAFASADVRIDETYTTADNSHNPLGLFATVAEWDDDDRLTLHDTTQWPRGVRDSVAEALRIDPERVRVLTPYVGGGFGAGLRVWPHVALAAVAARAAKRPVKLTLSRAQMFTSIGHRPPTVQQIALAATRSGDLTAMKHQSTSPIGRADELGNPITSATPELYACANVMTRARQMRLNIPPPCWMRAPGHAEGEFALETALDELAYAAGIDPIELRVRNHAAVHPHSGLPWSSNATLDCYRLGAERFGWSARNPTPRSMRTRDGRLLVGYGMARAALSAYQAPCRARVTLHRDGSVVVRSAGTDIGTGTYTVITQLTADLLGVPTARVRVELGDSANPNAPQQGGSGLILALGNAVHDACRNLVQELLQLVNRDVQSPLRGGTIDTVVVRDGGLELRPDADAMPAAAGRQRGARDRATDVDTDARQLQGTSAASGGNATASARFESFADILTRHGLAEIERDGESTPPSDPAKARAGSFAAHFVEVHVDPDLAIVRVARFVSAVDGGRILNEKTARSQIIGGIVGGIGMALLEETVYSPGGRIENASLGEYVIAVNADVPDIDVIFVGEPDTMTPIGTKGIGELSIIGVGAAISNAVYHATGIRIRSLPISLEKVLTGLSGPAPDRVSAKP